MRRRDLNPSILQALGQYGGKAMDAMGDSLKTLRAVINRIQTRHVRQQDLRGTDVGVGLFAADVLLTCLQGHAIGRLATRIFGEANDAAGHRAHM